MGRILVVDDNQANLDLMLYLLRAFGHSAIGARDGASGFAAAKAGEFDLVLTDILMPGMDGYEFARIFKGDPKLSSTQLLAVTALAMVGDRERILSAGFDGYISKPIDPRTFVSEVEKGLSEGLRSRGRDSAETKDTDAEAALRTRGAVILLVDDVPVNRAVLRSTLEPFGYEILEADDAPSALAICAETKPDLVLCDVHMPGGDGFSLIAGLKARADSSDVPIVLLSSTPGAATDRKRALGLGALKFLERPIDPRRLVTEVKEALKPRGDATHPDR